MTDITLDQFGVVIKEPLLPKIKGSDPFIGLVSNVVFFVVVLALQKLNGFSLELQRVVVVVRDRRNEAVRNGVKPHRGSFPPAGGLSAIRLCPLVLLWLVITLNLNDSFAKKKSKSKGLTIMEAGIDAHACAYL